MVKKILLLILVLLGASSRATGQDNMGDKRANGVEITAETADGLTMHGWFTPSPDAGAPLVVLLPMMGKTHESFEVLIHGIYVTAASATERKVQIPNFLSLDLRGHGASIARDKDSLNFQTMPDAEFKKFPSDVKTIVDRLLADKSLRVDRNNIVIVGASIGANTAIMTAPLLQGVTRVAMLSPGLDYHSLKPADDMKNFKGKTYICASEEDNYAAESSQDLSAMSSVRPVLHIYQGTNHGTNIILKSKTALKQLSDWLLD